MTEEDLIEWGETLDLIQEEEMVMSSLSFGKFVTVSKELLDQFINEINHHRIKNGNPTEGVDLIVLMEDEE